MGQSTNLELNPEFDLEPNPEFNLGQAGLADSDRRELQRILPHTDWATTRQTLTLPDLWQALDRVWDEMGCNAQVSEFSQSETGSNAIDAFYRHPVWWLNGWFAEQDATSKRYRTGIATWIAQHSLEISSLLDYGGGYGGTARLIAQQCPEVSIDIYEPYPHPLAIEQTLPFPRVQFVSAIDRHYDCLVSLDVLEHVPQPAKLLATMINSVRLNGYLIIANNFHPVIKCHLPSTFHLRYTFNVLARLMGLKCLGACPQSHAFIYQKIADRPPQWIVIHGFEIVSKLAYPLLQRIYPIYRSMKS